MTILRFSSVVASVLSSPAFSLRDSEIGRQLAEIVCVVLSVATPIVLVRNFFQTISLDITEALQHDARVA